MEVREATTDADIGKVKAIFTEYARFLDANLGMSLCYEDFDGEMAGFTGKYAAPGSR